MGDTTNATTASLASRYKQREQHAQALDEDSERYPETFPGCQFVAYVQGRDVKFNNKGGMEVTFTIPLEFVDYALPIRDAFSLGMPLSVDVQTWQPYADTEEIDE